MRKRKANQYDVNGFSPPLSQKEEPVEDIQSRCPHNATKSFPREVLGSIPKVAQNENVHHRSHGNIDRCARARQVDSASAVERESGPEP